MTTYFFSILTREHMFNWIILLLIPFLILRRVTRPSKASPENRRLEEIQRRAILLDPKKKFASLKINGRYANPFPEWRIIERWKTGLLWFRIFTTTNGIPRSSEELNRLMPVHPIKVDTIFSKTPSHPSLSLTWFGQSTCLMTLDHFAVLTDPVFTERTINDTFGLGPKRVQSVPCGVETFQDFLDIVIVSHDHFDHLGEDVVYRLGNKVTWYTPKGLAPWFKQRGVTNVVEMDWWQSETYTKDGHQLKITFVPALHWSGLRNPFSKNNSLWGSYVLQHDEQRAFFCGDTGYSPELFTAISEYGPFDLAAIPIGSHKPIKLMQHLHMGPDDAIKAHHDLGSPTLSVGTHWGTFMMSEEHFLDPPSRLKQVFNECDTSEFITTDIGETRFITKPPAKCADCVELSEL